MRLFLLPYPMIKTNNVCWKTELAIREEMQPEDAKKCNPKDLGQQAQVEIIAHPLPFALKDDIPSPEYSGRRK